MRYVKSRIEDKERDYYQYVFDHPLTMSEIAAFFSKIENAGYYDYLSYMVRSVTDSYEDGGTSIYRRINDINPKIFDNWSVIGDIKMMGGKRHCVLSDIIYATVNGDDITIISLLGKKIFEIAESAFRD